MLQLDAAQTRQRLPYAALLPALEAALREQAAGAIQAPERHSLGLPGGARYLVMPAVNARLAISKLVTVHPDNPAQGLAAIRGGLLVTDARDGALLALLDGPTVTARRTAALSMLGLQRFVPLGNLRRVALIGAGVQAAEHARAVHALFGAQITLSSRRAARAEALAAELRAEGVDVQLAADAPSALQGAQAVITATTSRAPVLPEQIDDATLIVAIGAFTPDMVEVPAALVRRRSLVVDTLEGARHEAGDLIQAGVDWSRVRALVDALDAPPSGPLLFKTVGHAAWDLAAACVALGEP
ncbi:MAG: ornithine cyclodeaminase [Methylibium sp.]|nr:ornithine cyclodeaminase [Methylibium sp.]